MSSWLEPPKFCTECGKEVVAIKRRVARYNPKTGKPLYEELLKCSGYPKWWQAGAAYHENEWYYSLT